MSIAEFFEDEGPTLVDPEASTWRPPRLPRPEDRLIELIRLRKPPVGGVAVELSGPDSLDEADGWINMWKGSGRTGDASFEVRFGDGRTVSGFMKIEAAQPLRDILKNPLFFNLDGYTF